MFEFPTVCNDKNGYILLLWWPVDFVCSKCNLWFGFYQFFPSQSINNLPGSRVWAIVNQKNGFFLPILFWVQNQLVCFNWLHANWATAITAGSLDLSLWDMKDKMYCSCSCYSKLILTFKFLTVCNVQKCLHFALIWPKRGRQSTGKPKAFAVCSVDHEVHTQGASWRDA